RAEAVVRPEIVPQLRPAFGSRFFDCPGGFFRSSATVFSTSERPKLPPWWYRNRSSSITDAAPSPSTHSHASNVHPTRWSPPRPLNTIVHRLNRHPSYW